MVMSDRAFAGLAAAVAWNPDGAVELLGVLRSAPRWVKVKDDPYGPLHLMLNGPFGGRGHRPPFPAERLPDCAAFGSEWRARRLGPAELAEAIDGLLPPGRRVPVAGHGWRRLV